MRLRGFQYAEQASRKSDFHKQSIGAVLMYGGKVLAIGYNTEKTHPQQYFYNKKAKVFDVTKYESKLHAEIMVLTKAQYLDIDFSKAELYIFRGTVDEKKMARPCPACEAKIRAMGIKNIYYTGNNSYVHERFD